MPTPSPTPCTLAHLQAQYIALYEQLFFPPKPMCPALEQRLQSAFRKVRTELRRRAKGQPQCA
jgi:hypothetical protein